jgi:O-methyltransferase
MIDETAALIYKLSPRTAPDLVLKRLGIATSRRRIEFYTLETLLRELPRVDGAIIECGTYRGATLLGMTHLMVTRGLKPRTYGLDSFEGFPDPRPEDAQADGSMHADVHRGALSDTSYEGLLRRIDLLGWSDRITVIKGFFDRTLPQLAHEKFTVAHLDCDLYESYIECLAFVYPRMLPGGVIVLDDYRLPANVYPGADRAVDEFFASKPEKPERLPGPKGLRSFVRIP